MTLFKSDRPFQLWDYTVSHRQLLLRSPIAPRTSTSPRFTTNVDLVFWGVESLSIPTWFEGLQVSLSPGGAGSGDLGASNLPASAGSLEVYLASSGETH